MMAGFKSHIGCKCLQMISRHVGEKTVAIWRMIFVEGLVQNER
jgi:hypothetical protein